jgi:acyl-CoA thioesterase
MTMAGDEADALAANALAQAVGAKMFSQDAASRGLGMTLEYAALGAAKMQMHVRKDMLNGLGTCHGGFIFTLADSTFAFACNSRNQVSVAAGCNIEYLKPGHENDVLTATAKEVALAGRSGIYDILVTNQNGETIATFRGKSTTIKGTIVEV